MASFLAEAIRGGGAAVVIVDPGHRARVAQALAARGIAVAAAQPGGMLIERDAACALTRLAARQGLDPATFETVIGVLLRNARWRGGRSGSTGRWSDCCGGAIRPARRWRSSPSGTISAAASSSLCSAATPSRSPQQADAVRQVAGLHSSVDTGPQPDALQAQPPDVAAYYDLDPRSPALARRMVRDVLTDRHLPHLAENAMIVVSELATNAVRHARSRLAVTLSSTSVGVRITVTDSSGWRCAGPARSVPRRRRKLAARSTLTPRPRARPSRCDLAAVLAPGGEVGQKGEDDVRA